MCPTLSDNAAMNNKYYEKCTEYSTSEIIWENLYDQGVIDTGIKKSKYHWEDFSWSIKIKVKGGKIETMYNMAPYKSKMMHVEDYRINSPLSDRT